MAAFSDIVVEKEITEQRLLPLTIVLTLGGMYLLPYQPAEAHISLTVLATITGATILFFVSTFLPFCQNELYRRNLLTTYQILVIFLWATELFRHHLYFTHLLIYLYTTALCGFLMRYSRMRLLFFLIITTLLIVWYPLLTDEWQQVDKQKWQASVLVTFLWNVFLLVAYIKIYEQQAEQTHQYLEAIEYITRQQYETTQKLYLERLHLKNIIDNIDVFVALTDRQGVVLEINQPFLDYIGAHGVSTALVGKPIATVAINEERKRIVEANIQAALKGKVVQGELYNKDLDKYLVLRYCPIKDQLTGEVYGVGIYYRDVTESYKTHQELQLTTRQLRAILDSIDQCVYLTDMQGRLLSANKRAQIGEMNLKPAPPPGELLVNNIEEPENRESFLQHHKEAVHGKLVAVEYYLDSLSKWMQVKYIPACDEAHNIFGVIVTAADITEQKQKEQILAEALAQSKAVQAQLAEREAMYKQLLNASADQIALKRTDSQYIWANLRFKEFYGELPIADNEIVAREKAEDQEVLLKKDVLVYQYWVRNKQGENHLLQTIKAPIWNQEGKIDKIAVFTTDITEQNERLQAMEELLRAYQELSEQEQAKARALAESQATLQLLSENTSELIVLAQPNGILKYVSPSVEKLTGFRPEEMTGCLWADFFHPDDLLKLHKVAEQLQSGYAECMLTHRLRTKNGRYLWLETIWKYIFNEHNKIIGIQTSSRDITERIAVEQAKQALMLRYQTLFKANYDAVLILKVNPSDATDLKVVETNPAAQELLGYSPTELYQLNIFELEQKISFQELRRRLRILAQEKEILLETQIRKKNGNWIWVEIAAISFHIQHEDFLQLTIRDISLRKQAEEAMKAKAIAEKSLEFKNNFLAKMSHEIRTPMNGLQGMTYLLLNTPLNERQRKIVESIQNSTKGLLTILNDILDLSKLEAGKLKLSLAPMDIRKCVEEVEDLFSAVALEKNLELSHYIAADVPSIVVSDYYRLRQVINNLVSNAIKFTPKGSVTIHVELTAQHAEYDMLKVIVRDTGIGIEEASFSQLFEKFYQANQQTTGGTGLGLAICKELVQLLEGEIGVNSQLNKGSEFWFTFKAWRAKQQAIQTTPQEHYQYQYRFIQPAQILLAEDVSVNQEVVKWMIEEIGGQVTVVANGQEACEQAKTGAFDLIIMDINMPVMDGITAVQNIRAALSVVPPIVGMSANAMAGDPERFMAQGMDDYLAKPITPEDLYKTLYRFLPNCMERTLIAVAQQEVASELANSNDTPIINATVIANIKKLAGNNVGMLQGLLESFITDIAQLRQKISQTHAQAQYGEMTRALHTLKGLCGTIGAAKLFEYTSSLYRQASEQPHLLTNEQLVQLFQLMDVTAQVVRQEYFSHTLAQ
ncbi:MAG: PAS domain S-box protein [Cytophagales bacterium]|nr:PAS domain S-box protein [Bernardetiaceae bacterium]MDW8204359.1 PAS domain S-box protein [Cytophagales bacterium]